MMPCLEIKSLTLRIEDKILIRDLNLAVNSNERWGLLGRNGAGKTSLLHSIVGIKKYNSGSIQIDGKEVSSLARSYVATRVGILFQEGIDILPGTVFETVMLGRHPHVQSILKDDPRDIEIARGALRDLNLDGLEERQVDTLSGGERQRLALAMLITQMPQLYLLDEPSNHLDVANQVQLLGHLQRRVSQLSASLLMATHDINLAARFCDNIVLLMKNGEYLSGPNQDILTEKNLSRAYDCPVRSISAEGFTLHYPY